jgi:hypothetical protein
VLAALARWLTGYLIRLAVGSYTEARVWWWWVVVVAALSCVQPPCAPVCVKHRTATKGLGGCVVESVVLRSGMGVGRGYGVCGRAVYLGTWVLGICVVFGVMGVHCLCGYTHWHLGCRASAVCGYVWGILQDAGSWWIGRREGGLWGLKEWEWREEVGVWT